MKKVLKYSLLYVILTLLFLFALIAVSFIPKEMIEINARESAASMFKEGEGKILNSLGRQLSHDNSTDAIMINLTYTIDEENRLESIIKARRNYIPGVTEIVKKDSVGNLPHEFDEYLMTEELLITVNNQKQVSYEYARYWHGYIVILRILLLVFNIDEIRWIVQIALFCLLGILMYYLNKNSNLKISIVFLLAFIATNLFVWFRTLQGMFVMIIAICISIFVANKKINEKNFTMWMFISGALTAYFDFLTTPLMSILLPIIVYTVINSKEKNLKKEFLWFLKNLFSWGIAYFSLWATKWILADLIYNMDIISVSFSQIHYRIVGPKTGNEETFKIDALMRNIKNSLNYLSVAIYLSLFLYIVLRKKKLPKNYFICSEKMSYYLCIITTIAWYFIITEHSYLHYIFTYKTMIIVLLSLMLIVIDNKNENLLKEKGNKND